MNDLVSVIIPIKNEETNIENCLQSILQSSYYNAEIIIVDNNSNDTTIPIAANLLKYKIQYQIVNIQDRLSNEGFKVKVERALQRNLGAEISKGKYLLFLDADMFIDEYLIQNCVLLCEKHQERYDGLYIREEIVGKGFWIRVRNFERSFYDGTRIDAIRFIKKSHWIPFDHTLTGVEDWDWDRRFKGKKGMANYCLYHKIVK